MSIDGCFLEGFVVPANPWKYRGGGLQAAHVTGGPLPSYAPAFALERYQDPEYQRLLENWAASGQL